MKEQQLEAKRMTVWMEEHNIKNKKLTELDIKEGKATEVRKRSNTIAGTKKTMDKNPVL